jgi:hypothetical protein
VEIFKTQEIYDTLGKIKNETFKQLEWGKINNEDSFNFSFLSQVELIISFDENNFLEGKNGIVWATYDLRQAEIIQSTLSAQDISSEIIAEKIKDVAFYIIKIINENDIHEAINFIWKSNNGLRLKPDWSYEKGENNKSFEQWLSGQ